MISRKNAVLLTTISLLSGCGFFEALLDTFSRISRENSDRPYFAYTLSDEEDPKVYLATISEDRKGLLRGTIESGLTSAELFLFDFSKSQSFLSLGFFEFINREFDQGMMILDVESRARVGFESDNTIAGYLELNCRDVLTAAAQEKLNSTTLFAGRDLKPVSLEYIDLQDASRISPSFWINDRHLVADYSLSFTIDWIDQNSGETGSLPYDIRMGREFVGKIDLRRTPNGIFEISGCGTSATPDPQPAETAELRVSPDEKKLTLDGVELENVLTQGVPLETRPLFQVTKWTFPF